MKHDEIASVCKVDTEPESTDEDSVREAFNQEVVEDQNIQNDQDVPSEDNEQQNDNEQTL